MMIASEALVRYPRLNFRRVRFDCRTKQILAADHNCACISSHPLRQSAHPPGIESLAVAVGTKPKTFIGNLAIGFSMNDLEMLLNKRAEVDTLVGRKVWTSVRVHDLLIPANSLQSRLHVFAQNLVRFTHTTDYPVQLIGSATGLDYRGNRFLICTAHQVKGVPGEDVGILFLEKQNYISSAGYTQYSASDAPAESDAVDLCLFDFTEQTAVNPTLARRFFRLGNDDSLRDEDNVLGYLAYGCPFGDQTYDIYENNHVGTVIRSMACDPEQQPSDSAIGACRLLSPMDFDPNGLSGGPVFATVLQGSDIVLKLGGIINRSGNRIIHFIKAKSLQRLLDLSISNPP